MDGIIVGAQPGWLRIIGGPIIATCQPFGIHGLGQLGRFVAADTRFGRPEWKAPSIEAQIGHLFPAAPKGLAVFAAHIDPQPVDRIVGAADSQRQFSGIHIDLDSQDRIGPVAAPKANRTFVIGKAIKW